MSWVRGTLILVVSLLLTGFQAAPGPFVLCIGPCEIEGATAPVEMVCWSGPEASGCCLIVEAADNCSGCTPTGPAGCVADAACVTTTDCLPLPCDGESPCPMDWGDCPVCLPGRALAVRVIEADSRSDSPDPTPVSIATLALRQLDQTLQLAHSHAPPSQLPAESGSTICIKHCLLLI